MAKRQGKQTIRLERPVSILSYASTVGKKESEGPLAPYFDVTSQDNFFGQKTWEKAESEIQRSTLQKALEKGGLSAGEVDIVFAGDLLNQCIGSAYGLREMGIPFAGLYGACSTMAESLILASLLVESGAAGKAAAVTSSHFCSAERQFRFPLDYGGQRTPTSQWTVTGGGACVVGPVGEAPYVKEMAIGLIEDLGVKDMNNMGGAMAPAAVSTLSQFFTDTNTKPDQYDLILTGDLGLVGSELLKQLMEREGHPLGSRHADCGLLIFDREQQQVDAGASGCGCSASVLCGYVLEKLRKGELKEVLFMATGALMSPTSSQQGESIPGIAHLVHLSNSPTAL